MTQTIGLKKKALVCLLAAAMGASALAGGILLDANAAELSTEDLVTVTNATVTPNKKYMLNAGTERGEAGLYVAPATENTPYQTDINGVFNGSFGMKFRFPGEGFWYQEGVNTTAEIVVSVSSIAVPDAKFEIHLGNKSQTFAYVTYDWQGQTLYRSRYSRWNDDFDGGAYLYTETLCTDTGRSQYRPNIGHFGNEVDATQSGYLGIEAEADGIYNVVLYGCATAGPNRKKVASFSTNPEDFTPVDSSEIEQGTEDPNLPKIDLSDGYVVSVSVSDPWAVDDVDFLIDSFAESTTGDPYADGGTVYEMNTETLADAPEFYTKWQTTPILTVGDYDYLNSSYVGAEVTLPVPSVTQAGAASSFTGTVTVTDSQGALEVTDGKCTIRNVGKHTVRYTQGESAIEITFNAYDGSYDIDDVVQDVQGARVSYEKDIRNLQGITLTGTDGGFSGKLAGSFSGNMSINFEFPQQFNDSNTGDGVKFTFTVYDADGKAAFDIVYENTGGWYTAVYVKMGDKIRTFIEDGSYDGWVNEKGTMFYTVPSGDRCNIYPGAGIMYNQAEMYGTLQLVWEGDVLQVRATNRNGSLFTFAEFDGSEPYSAKELDMQNAVVLDMTAERRFGLPMMDGSDSEGVDLTQGYSIGFSSSSAELPVTFLSVNGISLANKSNLTSDYVFSASVNPDQASVSGDDVYVAEGLHAGSVRRVYSYAFTGAAAGFEGSWGLRHTVVETDLDTFHNNSTVGDYTVTIPADGGDEWEGMDTSLNLHIETAWELTFDLRNGQVAEGSADPITYSEHTKFLLSVPEVERAFWKFDGWSTQSDLGDTWDGSFDAWSGDVTLYAKWADVTPATVVLADGIASYTEVLVQDGSFTISTKDVVASDAAQPDAVTLTVQYRQVGTADWTTLEGESVTIDNLAPGKWEIMYTVGDGVNEATSLTRTVAVIERAAPVVTVGDIATEAYVGFAVSVSATAQDADGNAVNVSIIVVDENGKQYAVGNGAFTPDKAGVYTVSFTAQDGSLIGYASHRVTVIDDTQNPDLAVDFADMTVERGSVVTLPAGTAQDNADPNVTVTVSVAFGTEQVELSGNTFTAEKEGTYTITWTAQDSAGNTATVTAYVTVQPAGGGSNVGLIIGIVAGVVVVAAAAVIVSVIVIRKKKVKAGAPDMTENDSDASENK